MKKELNRIYNILSNSMSMNTLLNEKYKKKHLTK